ncbi:MAG: HD-GYP domain-containing protein [Coriobacteriia bacterium]|nr:HD-GYP domain-containing protein [Coriobacteriia bacterium]MBN2822205.1 HD-GYP domain-containing protein [Coriobacteriia bacterium]
MSDAHEPDKAQDVQGAGSGTPDIEHILEEAVPEGPARKFSHTQVGRLRDVLARLYALRRTIRFYPLDHPATAQVIDELYPAITRYHDEGVDLPITFYEDELLLGEQLLAEDSVLFDQLIRDMTALNVGTLCFKAGLQRDELLRFASVLSNDSESVEKRGGIKALMDVAGLTHIEVSPVTVLRETAPAGDARKAARESYNDAVDLLRELDHLVRGNETLNVPRVKASVRSLVDNVLANRYAMLELSGLKSYDEYTFYHSVNVAILSLALGSTLTKEYRFLSTLGVGALLHDVGKMTIAAETLNKPGPLTSEEWVSVRQHPVLGAEHAALTPGLDKASLVVIFEHHMRYDLTGYPQQVSSRPQHLASRIVAVADAFDAMTSKRSYSSPRMQSEAIEVLARNAGTALDPTLVRLFVNLMGAYPPRSIVRLSTGETAIVVSPSPRDPLRPVVRIIANAVGGMIDPVDVDLSNPEVAGAREVRACLDPTGVNVDVADFL